MEICLSTGERTNLSIKTDPAPEGVHSPTKIETTAEYLAGKLIFLSPTSPGNVAAYDYRGDVRWYLTANLAFDLKRVRNGHLLMGTHRLLMPPYTIQPGFLNLA